MGSQADHVTSSQQGAGHDGAESPVVYFWVLISLTSTPELYSARESSQDLKEEGGI